MVEALIQVSYLVLPDNDFRVYEVVLAGTLTAANEQNRYQQVRLEVRIMSVKPFLQSNTT